MVTPAQPGARSAPSRTRTTSRPSQSGCGSRRVRRGARAAPAGQQSRRDEGEDDHCGEGQLERAGQEVLPAAVVREDQQAAEQVHHADHGETGPAQPRPEPRLRPEERLDEHDRRADGQHDVVAHVVEGLPEAEFEPRHQRRLGGGPGVGVLGVVEVVRVEQRLVDKPSLEYTERGGEQHDRRPAPPRCRAVSRIRIAAPPYIGPRKISTGRKSSMAKPPHEHSAAHGASSSNAITGRSRRRSGRRSAAAGRPMAGWSAVTGSGPVGMGAPRRRFAVVPCTVRGPPGHPIRPSADDGYDQSR